MIIKKLSFKNFKSFSSSSALQNLQNFDILTLIYGENNSGKSNILKFIDLLFRSKKGYDTSFTLDSGIQLLPSGESPFWTGIITNDSFMFHKNNRKLVIEFDITLSFYLSEINGLEGFKSLQKHYNLRKNSCNINLKGIIESLEDPFESEITLRSVELNEIEIFKNENGLKKYYGGIINKSPELEIGTFEDLLSILNDCVVFLDHNRFLKNEKESENIIELSPSNFKNWLHNLTLDPFEYPKFIEFISFIKLNSISGNSGKVLNQFEPTFSRTNGIIDVLLKSGNFRLPLNSYGTGIMQIILILASIFESKSKIILIEELELNLSPKSQQELLQILNNLIKNKRIHQVIFTSHSNTLAKTASIPLYEVELSSGGISEVKFHKVADESFYEINPTISKEINSGVREHGVMGPEWE